MTQVFDPEESIDTEVSELLSELAERAEAGATIADVEGAKIKQSKMRSMVHLNGVELPARTRVYDRKGFPSDVPTAQLGYHLGKRLPGGDRAFFSKPPAGVIPPTPVDVDCEWCTKRAGKSVKVFYDMDDYEAHCEYLHPREWASKLRKEGQANNVSSVEGILKLLANLSPEQRAALIGESA